MKKNPEVLAAIKSVYGSINALCVDLGTAGAYADTPALEELLSQRFESVQREECVYSNLCVGYGVSTVRPHATFQKRAVGTWDTDTSDVVLLSKSIDRAARQLSEVVRHLSSLSEVSLESDYPLNALASQTLATVLTPLQRGINNLVSHYQELAGSIPSYEQIGQESGELANTGSL